MTINVCGCPNKGHSHDCPKYQTVIDLMNENVELRRELAECEGAPVIDVQFRIDNTKHVGDAWRGFGVSYAGSGQYVFLDPAFDDTREEMNVALFDDANGIGLNIARVHIGAASIPPEGNPSPTNLNNNMVSHEPEPGVYNWEGNIGQNAAVLSAKSINPNVKVLASSWSPPGWLKTNGDHTGQDSEGNPGTIIDGGYDDYAVYLREYLDHYDGTNGVYNVDYMSPVNEPAFPPEGPGSYFTPEQLGELNVALSASLDGWEGELLSPEESAYPTGVSTVDYLSSLSNSVTGWDSVDGVAAHFYNANITQMRDASAMNIPYFNRGARPLYMTEITMFGAEYGDAMDLGEHIHWWMTDLKSSMFLYWLAFQWVTEFAGSLRGDVALIGTSDTGEYNLNKKYYVMGQYSKFIRPGWRRLNVTGGTSAQAALDGDTPIFVTTFASPDFDRSASVVVNRGSRKTARITGTSSELVDVYVTDNSRNMVHVGLFDAPFGTVIVNVPSNAVVTIVDR